MKIIKNELLKFYDIIWDQLLLSIVFTIIIYYTYKDYNLDLKKNVSFKDKILHCWHNSIVTQYTIGYGNVYPINNRGRILNTIHIILSYYLLAKDVN
jgi:hypothetical protein|tara:strand:+ start:5 stop:295 length:291 start_codon:yes stop_codon:yes gene_type:complete